MVEVDGDGGRMYLQGDASYEGRAGNKKKKKKKKKEED